MKRIALIALAALFSGCASGPRLDPRTLHESAIVLDTHLDTPALFEKPGWRITDRHDPATDYSQVDLPRMLEGGLDGGFWVIYTPQGARDDAGHASAFDFGMKRGQAIKTMVAANPNDFVLAYEAKDAAAIAATKKRIVYMSMENSSPIGKDLSKIKIFYDFGVRMMGPVHFLNNDLADSSTDKPEHGGLSALGEGFVAEANRLGIVIDASHASDEAFDDMLRLSATPLILSHSGVKAVFDHPRNIDDTRLKALAAKGGIIQINSYGAYVAKLPPAPERQAALRALRAQKLDPAALTEARRAIDAQYPEPMATFDDFMAHLIHALKLVGPDHVGIGPDWDGGGGVIGMEDIADLPRITERLVAAGYSRRDIEKIWSGNVLRVLKAAEDHAKKAPKR